MPPSVVSSDDEGGSDFVGRGGGGASSKFGFGLGRAAGGKFGFRFSPPTATGKGEETALVGGMRHLEMAPPDEAIPDAPVTTQDAQQQQPSQDAQHGSQETSPMGMHAGAGRATIGRSAWGPQDWFSANPRLDPSSTSAAHSVFPPAALAGLGLTSSSSYGSLAPASLVEGGMGEGLHSPPLGSSTSFYTPGGDGGLIAHRSNTAGDLILGAPNAFGPRMNTLHTTLMGPAPPLQVGDHGYGHGHSEAMYDLPFLDLHYFEGGAGVGDAQMQQMQLEGWRGGEALDLARSYAAAV
ncbi:hypothetical protein B0H19DRAFT_1172414 [Mycena capillaripes]|nr:hypothetical protein B0H19DRAFT_1172414 [Mycena capillaripes]